MRTVTCSTCGTESPAGTKFCPECGSPLPRTCSNCGHPVSASQKFCDECGNPLGAAPASADRVPPSGASVSGTTSLHAPPAPEQERRLVTILFADLVGSTALGESLDPEELYDLEAQVHGRIEASVRRYGGRVAKYLGDGVMALFGAPTAHEDDAERAVLAALAMQQALAASNVEQPDTTPPLRLRVGITSGEVVAGDVAGSYDVIGDAANVAARLQGAAEVGGVLVGEETMRLASRRVRFGHRQELALRGKAGPVAAYAVVGMSDHLRERWEANEREGYGTPLVGRGPELEVIQNAWTRARAGEGQLLTVMGEPGVGKSRLVAEGIDRLVWEPGQLHRVLRGRCLSYGQSISLWLIADLVRSLCSIPEDAGQETVGERITATVDDVLAGRDETDRSIARDVLGEVLGLPPGESLVAQAGPQIRRSSLIRSLGLVLGSLAETGPLLVVLEDLHWLDAASSAILEAVLTEVPRRRILVLATQRPGWSAPWGGWSWTERLILRPLPDEEAAELAGAVLGGARLSPDLEGHLRERAEGNPFFVEELLRYLQETEGLEQQDGEVRLRSDAAERLPATLTEVLLARLDRLESQVKGVAQVGSVIGRSFAVKLLARVMEREEALLDGPLRSLQQAEIAFPHGGGDLEYVFRHVTLRDVAYSTLVRRRQRQLHLAVGRAIAALYPADEFVELIAYHFARTDEHAEAIQWLERAGNRARDAYAHDAAVQHYRGALERLERQGGTDPQQARIAVELGRVLNRMRQYEEAQTLLEGALATYRQAGNLEGAGQAVQALGVGLIQLGRPVEALDRLQEMTVLLDAEGPSLVAALVRIRLANVYHVLGRYQDMLAAAERTAELANAVGDLNLLGRGYQVTAAALLLLGQIDQSRAKFEQAIPLLKDSGDLVNLSVALGNLAENRERAGKLREAVLWNEQSLEWALRAGDTRMELETHWSLATLHIMLGEPDRARRDIERAEWTESIRGAAAYSAALGHRTRGLLALREGRWATARQELDSAIELAAGTVQEVWEVAQTFRAELDILEGRPSEARTRLESLVDTPGASVYLIFPILAWTCIELGDPELGLAHAKRAEEACRQGQILLYLPNVLLAQGMALARMGRTKEAREELEEGRERAATAPHPYIEARILTELGLLDREEGEVDRARAQLSEALAIFRRLGAQKDVERAERELAALDLSADPAT